MQKVINTFICLLELDKDVLHALTFYFYQSIEKIQLPTRSLQVVTYLFPCVRVYRSVNRIRYSVQIYVDAIQHIYAKLI